MMSPACMGTGLAGRTRSHPNIDLLDDRVDATFDGADGDMNRPEALHYAPVDHDGVRRRVAAIAAWIADARPALMVVDVSCQRNAVVWAALGANLGIGVAKFVAATITGSTAMLTEGIHSVVDSGNQILLLYGERRAKRPPDALHPFGYGRELYLGVRRHHPDFLRSAQWFPCTKGGCTGPIRSL